jgi:general L-amino acid transport system substrate-binding protein
MKLKIATFATAAIIGLAVAQPASAQTLREITTRGQLVCGVSQGLAGFSNPDAQGRWTGLDVDVCRAIAAAIFDDPTKVRFVPLSSANRFTALQSREVDLLARNSTWTLSRDTQLGLDFTGINYYDGQAFMARRSLRLSSALELGGASVCIQTGTTTELNAADFFRANNLRFEPVVFATADETIKAYDSGRCDVFTTDASGLYAERLKLSAPNDHIVLPEIISKEPLGPVVRHGDNQFADLVRWVHFAMVTAEEIGVTQANVAAKAAEMRNAEVRRRNPDLARFVGADGTFGEMLGVTNDWAVRIIRHVGNYGESFERNVGERTPLGIRRGLNNLWTKGGLQYSPPIR